MAAPDPDLIPVVQKSYDLCAGLYTHVNRFPRAQRGLLGRVMLNSSPTSISAERTRTIPRAASGAVAPATRPGEAPAPQPGASAAQGGRAGG